MNLDLNTRLRTRFITHIAPTIAMTVTYQGVPPPSSFFLKNPPIKGMPWSHVTKSLETKPREIGPAIWIARMSAAHIGKGLKLSGYQDEYMDFCEYCFFLRFYC